MWVNVMLKVHITAGFPLFLMAEQIYPQRKGFKNTLAFSQTIKYTTKGALECEVCKQTTLFIFC